MLEQSQEDADKYQNKKI